MSDRFLIIGDTHIPYEHPRYLAFCAEIQATYRCNRIIHIGDLLDNHAVSYHEHNPDMDGPGPELKNAIRRLKKWHSTFRKLECLVGNHDALFSRKAMTAGLPSQILRSLPEMLEVPGWTFHKELIVKAFNHRLWFRHSWSKSQMIKGGSGGFSLICGHYHTEADVRWKQYPTHSCFSMHVGCGINRRHPAFEYGTANAEQPVISCATIIDGVPHVHRMFA